MISIKNPKIYLPIVVVVAILIIGSISTNKPVISPETNEIQTAQQITIEQKIFESTLDEKELTKYTVLKGETALGLLQSSEKDVKLQGDGENAFITSIRGITADESKKEYWALYVNGKPAEVGAGSYLLLPGDKIEWKIKTF